MIAITGAAGFIGSNIVWHLNQLGRHDLLVVDVHETDEGNANLAPLSYDRYLTKDEFRTWLADPAQAAQLETLYHMGACSSTTETDADYLAENNFGYTRELCELCLAADVRFINASSAATYGDGDQGYDDNEALIHELKPLNLYAHSKQDFDLWARAEGVLDRIVCLKYFNVYGPNEWHKDDMRSMVCKGYEQIRDHGQVKLFASDQPPYPDGGQQRDFVYVKDAVAMTVWFADHAEANGIFNVGTGQANDWNRLITAIYTALGREADIVYVPMPEHLKGKYQYHTEAAMAKLRAAGYAQPFTVLEEAVADYVNNHLVSGKHLSS
ncbi:MAG: ADP-glyceromanno-heptose 6-epimerase [Candidatus Krumholzibacteria bacterium]|nr:ADP-glyceromanno-heptose 6-epimerase [Candidatus Krumholzibacteria bacterium]